MKPPLGITPRSIFETHRAQEIVEAMKRYFDEGLSVPDEWINELVEINERRAKRDNDRQAKRNEYAPLP